MVRREFYVYATAFVLGLLMVCLVTWAVTQASCITDADALRTVELLGFTEAEVIARHPYSAQFYGCDKDDVIAFEIGARDPHGRPRHLVVCSSWPFKPSTASP